jgi:hypothetical protein
MGSFAFGKSFEPSSEKNKRDQKTGNLIIKMGFNGVKPDFEAVIKAVNVSDTGAHGDEGIHICGFGFDYCDNALCVELVGCDKNRCSKKELEEGIIFKGDIEKRQSEMAAHSNN